MGALLEISADLYHSDWSIDADVTSTYDYVTSVTSPRVSIHPTNNALGLGSSPLNFGLNIGGSDGFSLARRRRRLQEEEEEDGGMGGAWERVLGAMDEEDGRIIEEDRRRLSRDLEAMDEEDRRRLSHESGSGSGWGSGPAPPSNPPPPPFPPYLPGCFPGNRDGLRCFLNTPLDPITFDTTIDISSLLGPQFAFGVSVNLTGRTNETDPFAAAIMIEPAGNATFDCGMGVASITPNIYPEGGGVCPDGQICTGSVHASMEPASKHDLAASVW